MKKLFFGFGVLVAMSFSVASAHAQLSSVDSHENNQFELSKKQKKAKSHGYTILESRSVVIYKKLLPGNKQTGFKSIPEYYFGKGVNGEIKKLSIANLKNAFRENDFLLDQIDIFFRSDADLILYDTYRNTYKINYVLAKG